jgi:hypothetical protein
MVMILTSVQFLIENGYPGDMQDLTVSVQQPGLPLALQRFLFLSRNPDSISTPPSLSDCQDPCGDPQCMTCAGVSCGFKVSQWFNEVHEEASTAKLDRG